MNVFKLAVRIIARHWSYLLIYTLALGCMAILGSGAIEAPQASFPTMRLRLRLSIGMTASCRPLSQISPSKML